MATTPVLMKRVKTIIPQIIVVITIIIMVSLTTTIIMVSVTTTIIMRSVTTIIIIMVKIFSKILKIRKQKGPILSQV